MFLLLSSVATVFAAHVDCAVPTIGHMIELGNHGCLLDPFSLQSWYFGGHNIEDLEVAPNDTLTVIFGYTYETGTDRLSLLSATLMSTDTDTVPYGAELRSDVCVGSAFTGSTCSAVLWSLTSSATGMDPFLFHMFTADPVGGVLGFRHILKLPSGPDGHEYRLNTSGVIERVAVPEPASIGTSCLALLGTLTARWRRRWCCRQSGRTNSSGK
jgi:hypothetical protein